MARSFSATVSERVSQYQRRLNATFKSSAQDLVEEVLRPAVEGGRMKIDTGYLRSSLRASTSSMPLINAQSRPPEDAAKNSYEPDSDTIEAIILGASINSTLFFGFTASYARPREYQDGFVRTAAQQWQQIVAKNAARSIIAFR